MQQCCQASLVAIVTNIPIVVVVVFIVAIANNNKLERSRPFFAAHNLDQFIFVEPHYRGRQGFPTPGLELLALDMDGTTG